MFLSNQLFSFITILFAGTFSLPQPFLKTENTIQTKAREEIVRQYHLSPESEVKITSIPFGAVLIVPVDSETAEVHILRAAATQAELECNKIKIEDSFASLVITGNNNSDCRLQNTSIEQNIIIKLPRKTNIAAHFITGPLRIGEIEGRGPNYAEDEHRNKVLQPAKRANIKGQGFEGAVNIQSVSGAVKLLQGSGYSNISGVSGPIEITIRKLGTKGIIINGVNSPVEINFDAGLNSVLELSDIRGSVINNADVTLNTEGKKLHSRIGSGGEAAISISNVNGNVILSRD